MERQNIEKILIAIIQHRMNGRQMSQKAIADRLGVSKQQVWNVIHGFSKTEYIQQGIQRILGLDSSIWF